MSVSNAIAVIRTFAVVLFLVILYLVGESGKDLKFAILAAMGCLAMIEIFGIQDIRNQANAADSTEKPTGQ